ncbi:hypothetical protein TESG_08243 [Trichophyton tonsurans CBS 112818]|uniref:Uncharacterized protein n=1 Tax=Trichophyton tonsurans (strain CBS 112818) TaxID=647933 RepID=F2RN46_TRIT1|nr:hypothetical protein TESG_08243 [Trichophyton tonsurans CBS 112818]
MAATENTEGRVTPTQGELASFQAHAKALWAGKGVRSGVHQYSCIVAGMSVRVGPHLISKNAHDRKSLSQITLVSLPQELLPDFKLSHSSGCKKGSSPSVDPN